MAARAARQHGVVSRVQVLGSGVSKSMIHRRLARGLWEQIHPGVYRIGGAPESWHQSLAAAVLAAGPGAVASHRSAAALWRLPGFPRSGDPELIIPRARQRRRATTAIAVRRAELPAVDVVHMAGIPVTSAARTVLDLAAVAADVPLEEALDDALRRGLFSLPRLRWRLDELGGPGRAGTAAMRALLADRRESPTPQSVFERRMLRLLVRSRVPRPVVQHPIKDGGRLVAIVDFAFPSARIAIECDGYRWHAGCARWAHDLDRRNALTSLGWRVVHVTWDDLRSRPDQILDAIRSLLAPRD